MRGVTIIDSKERLAAIDPQGSFIVQAPAGSGKTGLLIKRLLALLDWAAMVFLAVNDHGGGLGIADILHRG